MKARSNLFRELRKSLKPGTFADQVTAQTNKFHGMRIGRSTAPGPSNTVDQAAWRAKYAACVVEWNDLTPEQKAAYQDDADKRKITAFNQFISSCLLAVPPPPYEDYTTYTEVDIPADRIQKTANHIDHVAWRNEVTYLYKDKGAGHFGDFSHQVNIRAVGNSGNASLGYSWALSNIVGDITAQWAGGNKGLNVNFYDTGEPIPILRLQYWDGAGAFTDTYNAVMDTWYYLIIKRIGTTLTCEIYDNTERVGGLLDTLTLEVTTDTFRYIYGCTTRDTSTAVSVTMDIENLKLE